MKIGIDIDDTLTDSRDFFIQHGAEYLLRQGKLKSIYPYFENLNAVFGLAENSIDIEAELMKEYITSCPLRYFAKEALEEIKSLGHEIYIITARWPHQFIDEELTTFCGPATVRWLMKNEIPFDRIYFTHDKGTVCKEECVDVMFDDSVSFMRNIKEISPETARIMMTTLYNCGKEFQNRVFTWPEFLQKVKKISVSKKKTQNEF